MNKIFRRALSITLALLLVLGCLPTAFARTVVVLTDEEKAAYTEFFNNAVNPVKTKLPKCTVKYINGVPENGITTEGDDDYKALDQMAVQYLTPILEGLFNNRSSMALSLVKSLLGEEGNQTDKLELNRGMLRKNTVPVYGQDYMSALTPSDDYQISVNIEDDAEYPAEMQIRFAKRSLEEAKAGAIGQAISLPSGSINPTVFSGEPTEYVSRLDDAKFQRFDIEKAGIYTKYNANGQLTFYRSQVTYNFSVTFLDAMNLLAVLLGYDFYAAAIAMVRVILQNTGKGNMEPDEVMRRRKLCVTYNCEVEISRFDFTPRIFGDVNDDNSLDPGDARAVLRHSLDLEKLDYSGNLVYADVDFDGQITPGDARSVLRMALGIDDQFTDVPEGKEIIIMNTAPQPEDPDEPEDPPEEQDKPHSLIGLFDGWQPSVTLARITEAVFGYIDMVKESEGSFQDFLTRYLERIENGEYDLDTNP